MPGEDAREHRVMLVTAVVLFVMGLLLLFMDFAYPGQLYPGQYAAYSNADRAWFRNVRSPRGVPCCDIADGHVTTWRKGDAGYEVPIDEVWTLVPPEAVVENAHKPDDIPESVVWYRSEGAGHYYIRCFVPGDGA